MSAIEWDERGQHWYENGVDHVVLYPASNSANVYGKGVAWNGVSSISQSPDGAEPNAVYADNIKYLNLLSAEEFKATIEAYNYPVEFNACNGRNVMKGAIFSRQPRKRFCLCYRTWVGNEQDPNSGYKLHIIYNALAAPSEEAYETINDSPEPMSMSWELSTTPVNIPGFKPAAHLVIDSRKVDGGVMGVLKTILYGSDDQDPRILMPDEIMNILEVGGPLYKIGVSMNGGSVSFALSNYTGHGQDLRIEWGDGETTLVTNVGTYSHTYESGDTDYEAYIYGARGLEVSGGADRVTNASFNGYGALIVEGAFRNCTALTSFAIPDGVTDIGDAAFNGCTSLTSVTIPDSVTSIGHSAFKNCTALTSFAIPDGVTSFGNAVFQDCTSLASVTIGNGVTSLSHSLFWGCSALASVTIPNSVTDIGPSVFRNCTALTSVVIPNSVTKLGDGAFYNCTSLTSVTIPDSVTSIGYNAFERCRALTFIIIPNSVTNLGSGAFRECNALTSVIISNKVSRIREETFIHCTSLTSVTFSSGRSGVPYLDSTTAFAGNASGRKFYVQADLLDAWKVDRDWTTYASDIEALP